MRSISSIFSFSTRFLNSIPKIQKRYLAKSSKTKNGTKLVIFDKDGTLICFHTMWTPWVTGMAHGLEIGTGLGHSGLGMDVYRLLGVCTEAKLIGPGLLAEATMPEIKGRLTQLLSIYGFDPKSSCEIIEAVWHDNEKTLHSESIVIKPIIDNLPILFQVLKTRNFKIAICTADNRLSTERTMKYLKLWDLIDGMICGDDPDSRPKPNPYNAMKLCRSMEVPPWKAYVVGDTLADLRMGREAALAGSIGVLSGIGTRDHLMPFADHIIEDVGDILPILIGDEGMVAEISKNHHFGSKWRNGNGNGNGNGNVKDYKTPLNDFSYSMQELLR